MAEGTACDPCAQRREFFSDPATDLIAFHILQPLSEAVAPAVVAAGFSPNDVTALRALLIVVSSALFLGGCCARNSACPRLLFAAAFAVGLAAHAGDVLDGYIARRYSMSTRMGQVVDITIDTCSWVFLLAVLLYAFGRPVFLSLAVPWAAAWVLAYSAEKWHKATTKTCPREAQMLRLFLQFPIDLYLVLALLGFLAPSLVRSAR